VSKEKLIKSIAKELSLDEIAVAEFIDAIFDTLILTFSKGKNVSINEFGRFRIQKKRNGELITKKLIFTPVKKLAGQINKNYNNLPIVKLRVVDSKNKDLIPEVGEKEFVYIMEDEVIISSEMFEEIESEINQPQLSNLQAFNGSIQEKTLLNKIDEYSPEIEETIDIRQKDSVIIEDKPLEEKQIESIEPPAIEETPTSYMFNETVSSSFELKEVTEERRKLLEEITELEKREKEINYLSSLEKLNAFNVDNFDISEKTPLNENELLALIGEEQNIFLIKEETPTQQHSQVTYSDTSITISKDEISEELKSIEDEISNLPSIDTNIDTNKDQSLQDSDKSEKIETTPLPDSSITSLQDAFEEINLNKQTEENLSLKEKDTTKIFEESTFKSIDYSPTSIQEKSKPQTSTTVTFDETHEKKSLNPYLKLALVFLLIFLLLILVAILF